MRFFALMVAGWTLAAASVTLVHHPAPPVTYTDVAQRATKATPRRIPAVTVVAVAPMPKARVVVQAALKQIGKPYVWGAKGPNAFDCSGLMQWSYKQVGVVLGPDTYAQVRQGKPVTGPPQPGDLIFPMSSMGEMGKAGPGHVVMAISATQVVEAPGRGKPVRVRAMPASFIARRIV